MLSLHKSSQRQYAKLVKGEYGLLIPFLAQYRRGPILVPIKTLCIHYSISFFTPKVMLSFNDSNRMILYQQHSNLIYYYCTCYYFLQFLSLQINFKFPIYVYLLPQNIKILSLQN